MSDQPAKLIPPPEGYAENAGNGLALCGYLLYSY